MFAKGAAAWHQARPRLLLVALLSVAAVAAALFTQHQLGMQPCPWCILQRIVFVLIAAAALAGALLNGMPRRVASAAVLLLAASGIAAALWQHFVAAASASCALTWADRIISGLELDSWWPEVFGVFASCADAKVKLLGVPYEFFSGAVFVLVAVLAWPACRSAQHGR